MICFPILSNNTPIVLPGAGCDLLSLYANIQIHIGMINRINVFTDRSKCVVFFFFFLSSISFHLRLVFLLQLNLADGERCAVECNRTFISAVNSKAREKTKKKKAHSMRSMDFSTFIHPLRL